jgi:hypothetical protein
MPTGKDPALALDHLLRWATDRAQTPIIFGVEPADLPYLKDWRIREIGRQPLFTAGADYTPELCGPGQPTRSREMRRQARRALSKNVDWNEVPAGSVWELHQRGALNSLLSDRWQRQPLAEFSFLVSLQLGLGQAVRRYFLLRAKEAPDAAAGLAILVQSDRGWLLEHQLVGKDAPNGSGELLVCRLLSGFLRTSEVLSLGITPLYRALVPDLPYREVPGILSFLPDAARTALVAAWEPLYGFRRLQSYREKLEPALWEPVYWAHAKGLPPFVLWAVLRVFAGGPMLGFAAATLQKIVAKRCLSIPRQALCWVNSLFVVSLCFWIPVLWNIDGRLLFGSEVAPKIWAIFDLFLVFGFLCHGRELARPLPSRFGPWLLGMVSADALLSLIGTALVHGPWPQSWQLGFFLVLLNAAPLLAALFLFVSQCRASHFLRHGGRAIES